MEITKTANAKRVMKKSESKRGYEYNFGNFNDWIKLKEALKNKNH